MTRDVARFRLATAALLLALVAQLPGCGQEPERESNATARSSGESDPSTDSSSEWRTDGERAERALAERDYGPERSDLNRFKGLYADPTRRNEHYVWSVSETCVGSGYLMFAATWGDVAPWRLASESDLLFAEPYPHPDQEPIRLAFEAALDGSIASAVMTGTLEATLERLGDLPEGWEPEGDNCLYR